MVSLSLISRYSYSAKDKSIINNCSIFIVAMSIYSSRVEVHFQSSIVTINRVTAADCSSTTKILSFLRIFFVSVTTLITIRAFTQSKLVTEL